MSDPAMYQQAEADPEEFWAGQAKALTWFEPWEQVLDWQLPFAKWFVGGRLNVAFNCLDRHVEAGIGRQGRVLLRRRARGPPHDHLRPAAGRGRALCQRPALARHRAGRPGGHLHADDPGASRRDAGVRPDRGRALGGVRGLFCRRAARPDRGRRAPGSLITADGGWRRGHAVELKANADHALSSGAAVDRERARRAPPRRRRQESRHAARARPLVARAGSGQDPHSPAEAMDAEDLLFLLYTSGTTARPKGIMHTTGGYLTQVAFTHRTVFDLKPETDVYWCAADIGWVTGHSYIVYGPLANGATSVLYEGTPDFPDRDRWWSIIERYGVTTLYTAPTAIRTFMKWGTEYPAAHDLSSLRLLGSVGEPINPEAWIWYWQQIGGGRCPVVDTWWQTETGAIMISPLPGVTTLKPGSATFPLPGIGAEVVDDAGKTVDATAAGTSTSRGPGRQCCGGSTATRSGTARPTGAVSRAATSPATGPRSTTTGTSGSWAGSTTS